MGSATSTAQHHGTGQGHRSNSDSDTDGFGSHRSQPKKPLDIDTTNKIAIVHTNLVAPIIIKNCNEEYQHVSNFDGPIVYGRLAEHITEHPLVQGRYFLVRDVADEDDKLDTLSDHLAPNVRQAASGIPVYGLGQPTRDALDRFVKKLKDSGQQDILLFNLRAEPVLFVRRDFDLVPYSPRLADHLNEVVGLSGPVTPAAVSEAEVELRKEVINLASLKDDQKFYFYDDISTMSNEPHLYRAAYEDDIAVTEEIYYRLTFYSNRVRYIRFGWSAGELPREGDFDAFLNVFKSLPNFFGCATIRNPLAANVSVNQLDDVTLPNVVFTSHRGQHRTTVAMVMAVIVLGHSRAFSSVANANGLAWTTNDGSDREDGDGVDDDDAVGLRFKRGNYYAVERLVEYLPNGEYVKKQVDFAIDTCSQVVNLRREILDSKLRLDQHVETDNNKMESERKTCLMHLERYIYLICFNAYLHAMDKTQFGQSFGRWMARQPMVYRILQIMDASERTAPQGQLLQQGRRVLVADDYIGLDVLSSHMDVKTSNFRRVPGLPIYGMAQPSTKGLGCVVSHLYSKKQAHTSVLLINLRNDLVIECDDVTYGVRDTAALEVPITIPGATASDVEQMEESLKNTLQSNSWKVYAELCKDPETKVFRSVRTCLDVFQTVRELQEGNGRLLYRRIPMIDDAVPMEKKFDEILSIINGQYELLADEDGPAFVFHCRTGKGRTTTAMAIAGLVICHRKGFPYGTKPGEEERVSLPNAQYTQGHYKVVQEVVRRIPDGHQVKREVDFILNQCSETMTPMHYHIREVIFVTYNKMKKAKTVDEEHELRKRSLDLLERYIYLILFNTYLHCDRHNRWQRSFSTWMQEVAAASGIYDILDNLAFFDFETEPFPMKTRRERWTAKIGQLTNRGKFI